MAKAMGIVNPGGIPDFPKTIALVQATRSAVTQRADEFRSNPLKAFGELAGDVGIFLFSASVAGPAAGAGARTAQAGEVTLDANALIASLHNEYGTGTALVDAALAGRTPVVPWHAFVEALPRAESQTILDWIAARGGRLAAPHTPIDLAVVNGMVPGLTWGDLRAVTSAWIEQLGMITNDHAVQNAIQLLGLAVHPY
jgi:hypothetical protein